MAEQLQPNQPHTVPIDVTGDVADFRILPTKGSYAKDVSVHVSGSDTASYQFEFGALDETDTIVWFDPAEYAHDSVDEISRGWVQSEAFLRLTVTTAAGTADATANILVSEGR